MKNISCLFFCEEKYFERVCRISISPLFIIVQNLMKNATSLRIEYLTVFFVKRRNNGFMSSIIIQKVHHRYLRNGKKQIV